MFITPRQGRDWYGIEIFVVWIWMYSVLACRKHRKNRLSFPPPWFYIITCFHGRMFKVLLLFFLPPGRRVKVCWHSRVWLPLECYLVECWLEDARPCKVVMMLCNLLCLRWTGAHLTLLLTLHIMHAGNFLCFSVLVLAADTSIVLCVNQAMWNGYLTRV